MITPDSVDGQLASNEFSPAVVRIKARITAYKLRGPEQNHISVIGLRSIFKHHFFQMRRKGQGFPRHGVFHLLVQNLAINRSLLPKQTPD